MANNLLIRNYNHEIIYDDEWPQIVKAHNIIGPISIKKTNRAAP